MQLSATGNIAQKKDTTRKDTLCMTVLLQYLRRNVSKEEQQNVV